MCHMKELLDTFPLKSSKDFIHNLQGLNPVSEDLALETGNSLQISLCHLHFKQQMNTN